MINILNHFFTSNLRVGPIKSFKSKIFWSSNVNNFGRWFRIWVIDEDDDDNEDNENESIENKKIYI